jgi:hypothetical protein
MSPNAHGFGLIDHAEIDPCPNIAWDRLSHPVGERRPVIGHEYGQKQACASDNDQASRDPAAEQGPPVERITA